MKKRSRAHEAGSIEAGSSISKSIFVANRVDVALAGQQNRASWAAQERTEQPNRASEKARGTQIEPFEARSTQQGRQGQPDRANRSQIEPARADQGAGRIVPACAQTPDPQAVEQFRY